MLHSAVEDAFDDLLVAWRVHDDLRRSARTPVVRLAQARIDLDVARSRVHRLRLALHPYGNDLELIGAIVLCEQLDEVVHIHTLDLARTDESECVMCLCGERVELTDRVSPRGGRRARA